MVARLNDEERRLWVLNDEGLYQWWKRTRLPMREFIRAHRLALDDAILSVLNKKPSR